MGRTSPAAERPFVVFKQADGSVAPPGIGHNSFRGPNYFNVDFSLVKGQRMPGILGEGAHLELRANFFNVFNKLNLASFNFGGTAVTVGSLIRGSLSWPGRSEQQPEFRYCQCRVVRARCRTASRDSGSSDTGARTGERLADRRAMTLAKRLMLSRARIARGTDRTRISIYRTVVRISLQRMSSRDPVHVKSFLLG